MEAQIITTPNIEKVVNELKSKLPKNQMRLIESEEFKIENAKEAIKEAYISSEKEKYIILTAKKFNIYAQNSLLKILEEPPRNIVFIIITNSKSTLLPTICSRLKVTNIKEVKEKFEFNNLDIKNLTMSECYSFLKQHQNITKSEAKNLIEAIFNRVLEEKIKLSEKELEVFSTSFKLIELNSRPINILTNILLIILNKNKQNIV